MLDSEPMPPEMVELKLCRDVYHCTPSELDAQDAERITAHIVCMNVEAEHRRKHDG